MKKLTTSVIDVLSGLDNIIFIGMNYIYMTKLSIALKCHYFDVVTFEILDFEGRKYEEVEYSFW